MKTGCRMPNLRHVDRDMAHPVVQDALDKWIHDPACLCTATLEVCSWLAGPARAERFAWPHASLEKSADSLVLLSRAPQASSNTLLQGEAAVSQSATWRACPWGQRKQSAVTACLPTASACQQLALLSVGHLAPASSSLLNRPPSAGERVSQAANGSDCLQSTSWAVKVP